MGWGLPDPISGSAGITGPPCVSDPALRGFPRLCASTPRRRGTRAACVMGAGNKDAQRRHRPPGLGPAALAHGSPRFSWLPGALRTRAHTEVGAPARQQKSRCPGLETTPSRGSPRAPAPAPTLTPAESRPASHPAPPRASRTPEPAQTRWVLLGPTSLPGAQNKAVLWAAAPRDLEPPQERKGRLGGRWAAASRVGRRGPRV